MIVRDPYWTERDEPSRTSSGLVFWVDLDRPKAVPFGFGVYPAPTAVPKAKKRKKAKK